MATTIFNNMNSEKKVFILPDVIPWGYTVNTQTDNPIYKARLKNMSVSVGQNIGVAEIEFDKNFGYNIQQNTPIKICIGNISTVIFRGFVNDVNSSLSSDSDTITAQVMDYKWFFARTTKVSGRWYCNASNDQPVTLSNPSSSGMDKVRQVAFKGNLNSNTSSGYLPNLECVFNENNLPNCYKDKPVGNTAIFMEKKINITDGKQVISGTDYKPKYWTYEGAIEHIVHYWLKPYIAGSEIVISSKFASDIALLKTTDDKKPLNLSIEGQNPLEALDTVIGSIPGKWVWWLSYVGTVITINIENVGEISNKTAKSFYLNDGSKLGELTESKLSTIDVKRDMSNYAKSIVIRGGKLRLCTTVKLAPTWGDGEPIKTAEEIKKWYDIHTNKTKLSETPLPDDERLENAYRKYCIPVEGKKLLEAIEAVHQENSTELQDKFNIMYSILTTKVKKMLAENTYIKRTFDAPIRAEFDNIVVFGYDDLQTINTSTNEGKGKKDIIPNLDYGGLDANNVIIFDEEEYTFDSDTGVIEFKNPQHKQPNLTGFNEYKVKIKVKDEKKTPSKDFYTPDGIASIGKTGTLLEGKKLTSRDLYATITLEMDLPAMIGDELSVTDTYLSNSSSFVKYIDLGNVDLTMHCNAWYPVLDVKKVKKPSDGLSLTKDLKLKTSRIITRCDNFKDYKLYPFDNDKVLLRRLKNFIDAIEMYEETITVDLGWMDFSYNIGEIITAVEGSEIANVNNSGYYGLLDYISEVKLSLNGETKGYSVTVVATNIKEYQASRFDNKTIAELIRPGVKRDKVKVGEYEEVKIENYDETVIY
jgi:hypothetical protein